MFKNKKNPIAIPEEFFESMLEDGYFDFSDEMTRMLGQMVGASVEHMKAACQLTKIIVSSRKDNGEISTEEILNIFRKSAHAIMDCTPSKDFFNQS